MPLAVLLLYFLSVNTCTSILYATHAHSQKWTRTQILLHAQAHIGILKHLSHSNSLTYMNTLHKCMNLLAIAHTHLHTLTHAHPYSHMLTHAHT